MEQSIRNQAVIYASNLMRYTYSFIYFAVDELTKSRSAWSGTFREELQRA